MESSKKHNVFIDGPISPAFIANSIEKHNKKTTIGAHSLFLGQVRQDTINNQQVIAIEYTTYREMAEEKFHEIREDAFKNFPLICMHIYHSLGLVNAGEISLLVFTSAIHRKDAINACEAIVERIKKEAPVWGKEILNDDNYQWKINS
ncbi:MAG: Molybdopterin synthase catalytic subunit MoaE [Cytophagales bacterium]|jgi:molybdopterin synthase catalytic subunit|nr:molybdenum cofactor biosynthesis protein MoaE [Bacteroidota bacterium]MBS1981531.1 molybdenum cofactor biosynthesis protein MoaE [Bacteroidota bacterium]WHZ08533.1 MAG: Molybdopterin synthase catalytic subunit MoaE [Cytophagales bacterium]